MAQGKRRIGSVFRAAAAAMAVLVCTLGHVGAASAAGYTAVLTDEAHFLNEPPSGSNISTIDLGASPPSGSSPISLGDAFDVAISPDANTGYAGDTDQCGTASAGNAVQIVDLSGSPAVAKSRIDLGSVSPYGLVLSPNGNTLYASGCGEVEPIDLTTTPATVGAPITVGTNPFSEAISQDGHTLWVANHNSGTVSVIDLTTATPAVVKTITVGTQPLGTAGLLRRPRSPRDEPRWIDGVRRQPRRAGRDARLHRQ
jgi:YVTN family beta-propeller protein